MNEIEQNLLGLLYLIFVQLKKLIHCISEIIINQPAFTSSVGGYSSYLAYPIDPKDVVTRLEAQFHFSSPSRDQVALLFFIGQEGLHEYGSDYVAISYVKGHILLTWDLGSGKKFIYFMVLVYWIKIL